MDIALDLAQKRKLPLPFFGQVDQMIKWFRADDVAALLYKKHRTWARNARANRFPPRISSVHTLRVPDPSWI
jgi:hypothetical protein